MRSRILAVVFIVVAMLAAAVLACSDGSTTESSFGIYLVDNGELVLSDKQIKSYYAETYVIELNEEGRQIWESYIPYNDSFDPPIPVLGCLFARDFVIKVDEEEIYQGKFYSALSSSSYDGIVILDTMSSVDRLQINFGYPGSFDARGEDSRDDARIIHFFEERGLLV